MTLLCLAPAEPIRHNLETEISAKPSHVIASTGYAGTIVPTGYGSSIIPTGYGSSIIPTGYGSSIIPTG